MNLKGYQGPVKKTATVFSNDPRNSRTVVTLQGKVKALVEVRPTTTVAFRGMVDQLNEKVVEFVSTGQPFHIEKVESNIDDKIGYDLETVENGKSYRLKVTNRVKQGTYSGFIKCLTDIQQKPEILIRVSGAVEGEIAVKPQTLLIGKLAAQQAVRSGKVLVMSNLSKPFQIKKLTYDERLLRVTQQALNGEPGFSLEVTPILENVPAGTRQQATIKIETDVTPDQAQEVQVHVMNVEEAPAPPAEPAQQDNGGKSEDSDPT